MDSAPTDGTSFIGKLNKKSLVFTMWRGKHHTCMTDSEKLEFPDHSKTSPFHPTRMTAHWEYTVGDAIFTCNPVGWIPMPE